MIYKLYLRGLKNFNCYGKSLVIWRGGFYSLFRY